MTSKPYARALLAGASAGLRTFTAPAVTLASTTNVWTGAVSLAAAGELVFDKLAIAPSRMRPGGLTARFFSGGSCGASLAARNEGSRAVGAALGALTALGTAWLGNRGRGFVAARGLPDFPFALLEDAIAFGLARVANTLD
jgi:uncharacterized membrane protein